MNYFMLTAVAGVLTTIIATVLFLKGSRKVMLANRIPGPKGSFLIGHLSIALLEPEALIKTALQLYRIYEKSLIKGWLLNNLFIILSKPEDIEFVLTNPKLLNKCKEYRVLQESIMGQGIFSIGDIKKWKSNRKMVSKGFSFTILKSFIPIFFEEANVLANVLQEKCDLKSNECDVSVPVSMATMEMIGRTALGVTFNAQKGGRNRFVENLQTAMHAWEYRISHPWFLSKTLFFFSSFRKKHDRSQKIINDFTDDIIKTKMNELNRKNDDNLIKGTTNDGNIGQKTVIEILLENFHGMSDNQIRDEIVTIMIGGQETTAMANACALFMLAHHQDVQKKVFEELQSIFTIDGPDRAPTYNDLQQMEYLERVIKETLRLFPPLPVFGRKLDEDTQIGEYLCPAGSGLVICPLFLQSSPLYYTDPQKFNPDNFLPEVCRSRHHYAFIPFSAGLRNCIGIKYAMIQMKVTISTLVRKIKLSPSDRCPTPENLRLMFLTTLKLVDGCYVKIEPRT